MSADNRLCLMKWGGGDQWYVWHGSCSESYFEPPSYAQAFPSEDQAKAFLRSEEERIEYLEGGTTHVEETEQRHALEQEIAGLSWRLDNLKSRGSQFPNWTDL